MTNPYRILLVEDDPDFARLVQAALPPPAYDVVVLATARSARSYLSETRCELAIIDGVLPDGLGAELVAWLRSSRNGTPIVFVSEHLADAATANRLQTSLGVHAVLPKPIDLVALAGFVAAARGPLPRAAAIDPTIATAIAALQAEFGRRLPSRARDLGAALERAERSSGSDAEALMLAHRLAGTAGSYGWHAISRFARRIEEELACEHAARDWSLIAELSAQIEGAAKPDDP